MPLVAKSYCGKVPLSDRVPDLGALEMLLAVAHTGSLNAASRQLGITQQAVSARVRSAEAQAGVALIARTPRGSSLTPGGLGGGGVGGPAAGGGRGNWTPGWPRSAPTTRPGCG